MIKKLVIEENHYSRLNKLSPKQKEQYYDIIHKIKTEKDEYIIGVNLADPNFGDYSVMCKVRYIDGIFHLEGFEYIKPENDYGNLKEGLYIGGGYRHV